MILGARIANRTLGADTDGEPPEIQTHVATASLWICQREKRLLTML